MLQGGSANVEKEKCIDYAELVGCDIGGVGRSDALVTRQKIF